MTNVKARRWRALFAWELLSSTACMGHQSTRTLCCVTVTGGAYNFSCGHISWEEGIAQQIHSCNSPPHFLFWIAMRLNWSLQDLSQTQCRTVNRGSRVAVKFPSPPMDSILAWLCSTHLCFRLKFQTTLNVRFLSVPCIAEVSLAYDCWIIHSNFPRHASRKKYIQKLSCSPPTQKLQWLADRLPTAVLWLQRRNHRPKISTFSFPFQPLGWALQKHFGILGSNHVSSIALFPWEMTSQLFRGKQFCSQRNSWTQLSCLGTLSVLCPFSSI